MHDCRDIDSKLLDLIFDEMSEDERSRLLVEIERCAECLGQYSSMRGTMRVFDRAFVASLPAESFWPQHHEKLRQHLASNSLQVAARRESFWKRFFALKLHVPVPVAAAVVIALLTLSALALRFSTTTPAPTIAAQPSSAVVPSPQVVEIPVVQEKVITRTVYVEKTKRELRNDPDQSSKPERNATSIRKRENDQNGFMTSASLTDYQPLEDMRIRIISRSKSDEK